MQNPTRPFRFDMVVFDVGGTLIGFRDRAPFQEFLAKAGLPATDEQAQILQRRFLSNLSNSREMAKGLGADGDQLSNWWKSNLAQIWPDQPYLAEEMLSWLLQGRFDSLYEDVLPTFEALQELGLGIGILSNWGTHLRAVLRRFGLDRYAQFVIVSAEVGIAKPDPRIFHLAIAKAGSPPDRLLYVGDHIGDDIEGAQGAGMDALLIDRGDRHTLTADIKIADLRQVIDYVKF